MDKSNLRPMAHGSSNYRNLPITHNRSAIRVHPPTTRPTLDSLPMTFPSVDNPQAPTDTNEPPFDSFDIEPPVDELAPRLHYNPIRDQTLIENEEERTKINSAQTVFSDLLVNYHDNKDVKTKEFFKTLPSRIQLILDTPFGKPSLNHSFTQQASFRLVLLPLF